ncbi:hypothetical protein Bca4012_027616 [Brassica carinata]
MTHSQLLIPQLKASRCSQPVVTWVLRFGRPEMTSDNHPGNDMPGVDGLISLSPKVDYLFSEARRRRERRGGEKKDQSSGPPETEEELGRNLYQKKPPPSHEHNTKPSAGVKAQAVRGSSTYTHTTQLWLNENLLENNQSSTWSQHHMYTYVILFL